MAEGYPAPPRKPDQKVVRSDWTISKTSQMRIKRERELRKAFRTLSECFLELWDDYCGLRTDQIARELFSVPGPGSKRVAILRSNLRSLLAPHNGGANEYSFDRNLPDAAAKNREYHHALEIVQGFAFGGYLDFLRPQPKFRLGPYES